MITIYYYFTVKYTVGEVASTIFSPVSADIEERVTHDSTLRIRDMGRLLLATEIRSAKTYWHVQSRDAVGVPRIYPGFYYLSILNVKYNNRYL